MNNEETTNIEIAQSMDAVKDLLSTTLNELRQTESELSGDQPRYFFPNGIELFAITIGVGETVQFALKVAGEKGISGSTDFEEDAAQFVHELDDSATDVSPEPLPEDEAFEADTTSETGSDLAVSTAARAYQEIRLGYEIDRCSGRLTVRNRYGRWIFVPRGRWTVIDVAVDGNGYWRWRCGGSRERSRGAPNFRQRVKRLKVYHSTGGRKITWWCYDLL